MNKMAKSKRKVGLENGKFHKCPKSPNCVSTQCSKDDKTHFIKPIKLDVPIREAREKLRSIINSLKRTKIITQNDFYMHVEFKSGLFRFVDDVEFYFDEKDKLIHFKSASRVGYGDFGVNRKRMEKII